MSMGVSVRITGFRNERGQFAKIQPEMQDAFLDEFRRNIGPSIIQLIQRETPRQSGTLAEGWAFSVDGDAVETNMFVENKVGYLDAVLKGRRPGPIYAREKQFMRFQWRGEIHYRKRVWHPGTRPNPFLQELENKYLDIMSPALHTRTIVVLNTVLR